MQNEIIEHSISLVDRKRFPQLATGWVASAGRIFDVTNTMMSAGTRKTN